MIKQPKWLHWLDRCPSTNSWSIDNLSKLNHGDVVFTPHQTAGRGQHGRVWHSSSGVLTASFVIHAIPIDRLAGLSSIAGLAVIYSIEDLVPTLLDRLRLKWPNDVMLNGKKLAGILCESVINSSTHQGSVVIGIGLNRTAELDSDLLPHATSLSQWVAAQEIPASLQLVERLRHYLLEASGLLSATSSQGLAAFLPAIRQRDFLDGNSIEVEVGTEHILGEAAGISDRGYLIVRLANGELKSIISGHIISHQFPSSTSSNSIEFEGLSNSSELLDGSIVT
mgnify:CR=1 FL=1